MLCHVLLPYPFHFSNGSNFLLVCAKERAKSTAKRTKLRLLKELKCLRIRRVARKSSSPVVGAYTNALGDLKSILLCRKGIATAPSNKERVTRLLTRAKRFAYAEQRKHKVLLYMFTLCWTLLSSHCSPSFRAVTFTRNN